MHKNKAEVIHKVHGFVMQNIRLDGVGENLSSDVIQFCDTHVIQFENFPAYAPQNKGTDERLIQRYWTRNRTLLFASNLPNKLWGETVYFFN